MITFSSEDRKVTEILSSISFLPSDYHSYVSAYLIWKKKLTIPETNVVVGITKFLAKRVLEILSAVASSGSTEEANVVTLQKQFQIRVTVSSEDPTLIQISIQDKALLQSLLETTAEFVAGTQQKLCYWWLEQLSKSV
jgi:hypothetical protein